MEGTDIVSFLITWIIYQKTEWWNQSDPEEFETIWKKKLNPFLDLNILKRIFARLGISYYITIKLLRKIFCDVCFSTFIWNILKYLFCLRTVEKCQEIHLGRSEINRASKRDSARQNDFGSRFILFSLFRVRCSVSLIAETIFRKG